jgi:hypothetical protein
MQGNSTLVSWDQLVAIVTVIFLAGGAVAGGVAWLWTIIFRMQRQHDNFRVEVANKLQSYVSTENLRQVEDRIEGVVKELREDFRRGFDTIIDLMKSMPGIRTRIGTRD